MMESSLEKNNGDDNDSNLGPYEHLDPYDHSLSIDKFLEYKRHLIYQLRSEEVQDSYYIECIQGTLERLLDILKIKKNQTDTNFVNYHYHINNIRFYDLSTLKSIQTLSYDYYDYGTWFECRSLQTFQDLYKNFLHHQKLLQQIKYMIDKTSYQKQELANALSRLQGVIYIQDRYGKEYGHAYDMNKARIYPLKTLQDMLSLRVDVVVDGNIKTQQSIQDILRIAWCEEIQLLIEKNVKQYTVGMPDKYIQYYQDSLDDALFRLKKIVTIKSQENWMLAQDLGFHIDEIVNYDLSSLQNCLTLCIYMKNFNGRIYKCVSISFILDHLQKMRIATCLYNSVYIRLLPEIFRLQNLAEAGKNGTREDIKKTSKSLCDALRGLYWFIWRLYIYEGALPTISGNRILPEDMNSITTFMHKTFDDEKHPVPVSLYTLIHDSLYIDANVEKTLFSITVEAAFSESAEKLVFIYDDLRDEHRYPSIEKIKNLCALAELGDLEQIKVLEPTKQEIDYLVDCPLKSVDMTSLDACIHAIRHNLQWIGANPVLAYIGRYNALMVAVIHQHYKLVEYFLREKQANPDIKGGRKNDYSARDCMNALNQHRFLPPPKPDIIALFNSKQCNNAQKGSDNSQMMHQWVP